MNLRFSPEAVRFRVTLEEAKKLQSGVELEEETHFPAGGRLVYRLSTFTQAGTVKDKTAPLLQLSWGAPEIELKVEEAALEDLLAHEITRDSAIEADLPLLSRPRGEFLHLSFEVDAFSKKARA